MTATQTPDERISRREVFSNGRSEIRVAMVGVAPLFGEKVRCELEREVDIRLIAESIGVDLATNSVVDEALLWDADVIIAEVSGSGEPAILGRDVEIYGALAARRPDLRIIAVTTSNDMASVRELDPHSVPLGDVPPPALVDVIRQSFSNKVMWQAFL